MASKSKSDGTIHVYFHTTNGKGGGGGDGGGGTDPTPEDITPETPEDSGTNAKQNSRQIAKSTLATAGIQACRQLASYGFSIMGDLTGNYMAMTDIQQTMNMISTGVMLAQFPVGTIAGITQLTTQAISQGISRYKENKQTELYAERCGNETRNDSEVNY